MRCKLNIIEPWESGTYSAIDAVIVRKSGIQFLLSIEKNIIVRGERANLFNCKLKSEDDNVAFTNHVKGVYPIRMVFDENITVKEIELPELSIYRSNFLSGEIIL